ncbi:DM13 domain-containing protein [Frankia sp. CcWB3]
MLGYPRSSLLVPVVAALGGLVFAAWKPGVIRSAFASPRSVAFTLVIMAAVAGLGFLLPRLGRGPVLTGAAQAVPVLLAFVVTVLPAFRNVTVEEELPADVTAVLSTRPSPPGAAPQAGPAPGQTPPRPPAPTQPAAGADVVELGRAQLVGIDHDATGTARLIRLADGSHLVRFEDLDVEPGPDYQVHLVPGADKTDPAGSTRLDRLRGNLGDQNYPVAADVDIDTPTTVLIWCRAFAVPIAAATVGV